MVRIALIAAMAAATVMALPQPQLTPDPNGAANIGNGQGGQFITGACLSDADCASGCCAVLGAGGICSGPAVSFAQGKQGCGFGGAGGAAAPPPDAAPAAPAAPAAGNGAGGQNVGNGAGLQFITGQCLSDADCASTCCAPAANGGSCAARLVAEEDGRGCGFGGGAGAANNAPEVVEEVAAPPAAAPAGGNGAAGSQNVGNGAGQQFITGECVADADCASTCCAPAANGSGSCAARLVAEGDGRGCGFGGAGGAGNGAVDEVVEAPPAPPAAGNGAGGQNVGNGAGQQFITGECVADADCASTCCAPAANGSGSCAARLVAEEDGRGCGFSS